MPCDQFALQSYYGARASEYDSVYLKPERQSDLLAIRQWLPSHFDGASVLEIACGTGYWTQFIAPVAANVLAIDAASETLAIAKSRVAEGNVKFLVEDAYSLPNGIGTFDSAFAGFWFSHIPMAQRLDFFAGLSACLRPGSNVVLLDNIYVEGSSTPISEKDSAGNTYQTRRLSDGTSHRILKNFPTGQELRSSVAGISESCALRCWKYYWAFEFVVA